MKKDNRKIWKIPNMILIAGDGRNVGKTTFAREIIQHFSKTTALIGLKVSPHLHETGRDLEIIFQSPEYVVAEEKGYSEKDSSLFLQAGAKKVFFIMAGQEYLKAAFSTISDQLNNHIIVAESGGLIELIEPGIFFFIRNNEGPIKKEKYLKYKPIMVMNGEKGFDFKVERLDFQNNKIVVN